MHVRILLGVYVLCMSAYSWRRNARYFTDGNRSPGEKLKRIPLRERRMYARHAPKISSSVQVHPRSRDNV